MEDTNQSSGQTENTSGDVQQTQIDNQITSSEDKVAYSTHKKLLAEKKNLQARFEEMEKKFNTMNEEKLTTEGKKDELLNAYKTRAEAAEDKLNSLAYTAVSKDVMLEAQKMGCINNTLLMKALDLSALQNINGDLSTDVDEIKTLLEATKKEYPMLFKKKEPNVHDGVVKKAEGPVGYAEELAAAKTQKQLEEVLKKHGRL